MAKKNDKPDEQATVAKKGKEKKPKNKVRENIESILIAVALAFSIRYFVVEAFKIPTGSMAPTLLGAHKNILCPNCDWEFESDINSNRAMCSNCLYEIDISRYCKTCSNHLKFGKPEFLRKSGGCPQCGTKLEKHDASNRVRHGGNRIAVSKLSYKFGDPKRWDVIVFIYPVYDRAICKSCSTAYKDVRLDNGFACKNCGSTRFSKKKKNYIKRLVGLPGEKLEIINGDIYINDKIQQKPDDAQNALWNLVYNSNLPPKEEVVPTWLIKDGGWTANKTNLILSPSESAGDKMSYIRFGRKITDKNPYNTANIAYVETGDMMIKFDIEVSGSTDNGGTEIIIEENDKIFTAFLPVQGNKNENAGLTMSSNKTTTRTRDILKSIFKGKKGAGKDGEDGIVAAENKEFYLESGKRYTVKFSNVDNVVKLFVNDAEIFNYSYDLDKAPQRNFNLHSGLRLGGKNIDAVLDNIEIKRDIYYSNLSSAKFATKAPTQLGEEDYFVLGDNSRNSNDSRVWGYVNEDDLVGKAFFVWWPVDTIKLID